MHRLHHGRVLKPRLRVAAWIPGTRLHKSGHDADGVDQAHPSAWDARGPRRGSQPSPAWRFSAASRIAVNVIVGVIASGSSFT
jgi:hypothetical protein